MEFEESTDASSDQEITEVNDHCKDVPKSSYLNNVEESNLYEVSEEMDCSETNTSKWNPVDASNRTLWKTNFGPAESRIVIGNIPSQSTASNSLMCEKYSFNKTSSKKASKVEHVQNPFSMRETCMGSTYENIISESIGPENVKKCPLIYEQELSANAPDVPEYQRFQTHSAHNDNFDPNVVTIPPFHCSNTEKTKVVKRTCFTLEKKQYHFLKSSRCNSSETICCKPFLHGKAKHNSSVSNQTLNVSILKVIDQKNPRDMTKKHFPEEQNHKIPEGIPEECSNKALVSDLRVEKEKSGNIPNGFPKLTREMEEAVSMSLCEGCPLEILSAINYPLFRRDFKTLDGITWLNDNVITSYFDLIVERSEQVGYPSVYAFNTFFYSTLKKGYTCVRRWTKKIDIFSFDLNFVPIHLGVHWCLAVIDHRARKISYHDSLGYNEKQCLDILCDYLLSEHKDKKGVLLDPSTYATKIMDSPQQRNGGDCGVFTLKYAEYISRNAEITFNQSHMPYFRKLIICELLNCRLFSVVDGRL